MNNMGNIFDEMESELLKKWRAVSAEQRAEEERLRKIQRDWEAAHTAIETDEDRADSDRYPEEDDDEQTGD